MEAPSTILAYSKCDVICDVDNIWGLLCLLPLLDVCKIYSNLNSLEMFSFMVMLLLSKVFKQICIICISSLIILTIKVLP